MIQYTLLGGVAQLGERSVRIREVKGSNPSVSTIKITRPLGWVILMVETNSEGFEVYTHQCKHSPVQALTSASTHQCKHPMIRKWLKRILLARIIKVTSL